MKRGKVKWPLRGRLEEIEWRDHMGGGGWRQPAEYAKESLSLCTTVGYLLSETRDHVTVVQNMSAGPGHVDNSMIIGKALIIRRTVLRPRTD